MPSRFSQEGIFFLLLLSQFQYSSHALVDTLLGDGALVDGVHHGIESLHQILRTQYNGVIGDCPLSH